MKFRIFLKSFNSTLIQTASAELRSFLVEKKYKISNTIALPIKIKRFCVLRSPHVDKDSREHFEMRLYKQFLDITTESSSVLNILLKIEFSSGVACSLKILK